MANDEPTKEQLEAEFSADDKELCNAATKIQASFRGHQSRKEGGGSSSNAKVEELSKDMQKMAQEVLFIFARIVDTRRTNPILTPLNIFYEQK
ncbi:unnamed protein product [Nesidiocoris tenuis]|nr:unnamed protein product [Nesidiocoris tenuis]